MKRAATLLAIGAVLTVLLALAERVDAGWERDLLFYAAEDRVQRSLRSELENELEDFRSTIRFVEATHPGPIAAYQSFVDVDLEPGTSGEAGAVLLERIPRRGVKALEAREHALGNDDFSVVLIPVTGSHRLIVTRAGSSQRLLGLPSLGLDLTASVDRLLPAGLAQGDVELHLVPSNRLVNMMQFVGQEQASDHTLILVAPVQGADGQPIGHSLVFRSMAMLLDRIEPELTPGLGLAVGWDGEVVGLRGTTNTAAVESVGRIAVAGGELEVQVFADEEFGRPTGLADQRQVLTIGLLLTLLAVAVDQGRSRSRRRLVETQFELAQAQTMARSDQLTGLLNREGFLDSARLLDDCTQAAVFFVDLDGFKAVNDSLGHEEGDQLLRRVAKVLRDVLHSDDLISRYGGDEFVAFIATADIPLVTTTAQQMIDGVHLADPRVSCSIGVAVRPEGRSIDVKDLVREADGAMYAAKLAGGSRHLISDRLVVSSDDGVDRCQDRLAPSVTSGPDLPQGLSGT